jgi:hypothetical protein
MKFLAYLASPWTDVNGRQSSHGDSVSVLDGVRGLAVLIVLASHERKAAPKSRLSPCQAEPSQAGYYLAMPDPTGPRRVFYRVSKPDCSPRESRIP